MERVYNHDNRKTELSISIVENGNPVSLEPPVVIISEEAYADIRAIMECGGKNEIGGMGFVDKINRNTYYISEVFIVEQEVHGTTTELSGDAMVKAMDELIATNQGDKIEKLYFWFHSHVDMACNPSGQDMIMLDKLMKFVDSNDGVFIAGIFNNRNDVNIIVKQKIGGIYTQYNNIPLSVRDVSGNRKARWKGEVDKKVKQLVYTTTYTPPATSRYTVGSRANLPNYTESTLKSSEKYKIIIDPVFKAASWWNMDKNKVVILADLWDEIKNYFYDLAELEEAMQTAYLSSQNILTKEKLIELSKEIGAKKEIETHRIGAVERINDALEDFNNYHD